MKAVLALHFLVLFAGSSMVSSHPGHSSSEDGGDLDSQDKMSSRTSKKKSGSMHDHHHDHDHNHQHLDAQIGPTGEGIKPPPYGDKAATARWIAHNTEWCSISTINSRHRKGSPFGNIASFSDGAHDESTGHIYFLHSSLDASIVDVMANDDVSIALSEMQTGFCQGKEYDAEDPRCARLSLGGHLVQIDDEDEIEVAKHALFTRHPVMKDWYGGQDEEDGTGHDFRFWKLELEEIWLVDFFGGAALITTDAWFRGTDVRGGHWYPSSIKSASLRIAEAKSGKNFMLFGTIAAVLWTVAVAFVTSKRGGSKMNHHHFQKIEPTNGLEFEVEFV